ncbi:MerR family transcriptional regulator [Frankia sp. AgB1.9]|uniref:MerR family transcriptional regulator n=1 Tax=unclassified Frankia TaxID=2632575 RepID=UPI001932C596|nr:MULTISPECIES: MerR family transcriptional regulator [unclassified Frankia]MBL7494682.1 MerR family transcriptional regulator [Frankia sp. AgW1.1]MBL7553653.1 MerR family transcriptional regulator [Frankia sp. AgB1.9]MBL7617667.1 MerR family transcriptional regulator [Frankia sp. AgB1.8]
MDEELVPIDEVARRVGLRASAIRYYEQRGLIAPAVQSAGRRWYCPAEIRRLAVIRYWQRSALMSLDDIADLLASRPDPAWKRVIEAQIESLQVRPIGSSRPARCSNTPSTTTAMHRRTVAPTTNSSSGPARGLRTTMTTSDELVIAVGPGRGHAWTAVDLPDGPAVC